MSEDDKSFTRELCFAMVELMEQYHFNRDGSDYTCAHCHVDSDQLHHSDCLGLKCKQWLKDNEE